MMFEPVPMEMLRYDALKPQVMITVDGLEVLCPDLNCDYVYEAAVPLITEQTLTNNVDLRIVGTDLPTTGITVALGNVECTSTTITATATEITCTLSASPAAGSWDAAVTDAKGLIPVNTGVAKIDVTLAVNTVTPATGLNQLGGDTLVFAGLGLTTECSQI
jgi:hypothetical protein